MISYENEIFTKLATILRTEFEDIFVASTINLNPPKFPCVFIEEADNYPLYSSADTGSIENHVVLMYEVNVFSNKTSGKKREAKEIFNVIDGAFEDMGFRRITLQPMTIDDSTKYRLVGRYTAVADGNKVIYRR